MPMNRRIIPLIMCGGAGTRLWPASREVHPKQFLSLFGARSTFQDTLMRVSDPALFERPIVITNASYRFMVLEQLAEVGIEADDVQQLLDPLLPLAPVLGQPVDVERLPDDLANRLARVQ